MSNQGHTMTLLAPTPIPQQSPYESIDFLHATVSEIRPKQDVFQATFSARRYSENIT